MAAGQPFDPYHAWLGIHPSEQPADFYRLLGICRFESNVAAIQAAYIQRFNYLKQFAGTQLEAVAQQLAQELLSAQTALLSPVLKASYDAGLAARMQPPPVPEPQAEQPEQPALEPEPAIPAYSYDPPVTRRKPRHKSDGSLKQMAGSVAGLVIGFLILMFLRPDLFQAAPAPAPPPPKKLPEMPANPPKVNRGGPKQGGGGAPPGPMGPIGGPNPGPQPPPPQAPPAVVIPKQIDLPDRNGKDHVETALLGAADAVFDIRNPVGNPLQFQVTVDNDQQAWTITDGQNPIAKLNRENGRINLRWAEDTAEAAECLRNSLLVITAGGDEKTVLMRSASSRGPLIVDLSKKTSVTPVTLELWGLDHEGLQLAIESVSPPAAQRFDPIERRVQAGKKVRAILRDQLPYAALAVRGSILFWPGRGQRQRGLTHMLLCAA